MYVKEQIRTIAENAKKSAEVIAQISSEDKNRALRAVADNLMASGSLLIEENSKDLAYATKKGLSKAMMDRLTLTEETIKNMATGISEVAALPDPVGAVTSMWKRPNGLLVGKQRIPLGVIGIIYESRPNVTADAASLCLKSGNAVILRGGSEAINSNLAIAEIMQKAMDGTGIPKESIQVIPTTDRTAVEEMLKLDEYIDLIIPRGGEELIRAVVSQSQIPVIKHYKGVCHIFVDESADLDMASEICLNAKTQKPGVCNAMETLLIHSNIAGRFVPSIISKLREKGVSIRGCERTRHIQPDVEEANEKDWHTEYLDLILSIRIVDDIEAAIKHIKKYGSLHTESIITTNYENSQRFLKEVNSSTVMINASTRFSDGFELGLGAEIGISTTKLHAFGPMGLEELTTTKFIIFGNGQVRK